MKCSCQSSLVNCVQNGTEVVYSYPKMKMIIIKGFQDNNYKDNNNYTQKKAGLFQQNFWSKMD